MNTRNYLIKELKQIFDIREKRNLMINELIGMRDYGLYIEDFREREEMNAEDEQRTNDLYKIIEEKRKRKVINELYDYFYINKTYIDDFRT